MKVNNEWGQQGTLLFENFTTPDFTPIFFFKTQDIIWGLTMSLYVKDGLFIYNYYLSIHWWWKVSEISSTTHDDTSATTAAIYRNQCFKNKSNTTFQYCIFIFFLWTYKYDTSTYAHILIQMSILNEKTYLPTCTYHEYFDINIFL